MSRTARRAILIAGALLLAGATALWLRVGDAVFVAGLAGMLC